MGHVRTISKSEEKILFKKRDIMYLPVITKIEKKAEQTTKFYVLIF